MDIGNKFFEKISSYDIFNNFFPGLIFCCILEKTTRFSLCADEIWEAIFLYYFVGMIISCMGSFLVEEPLKRIKIKDKKTGEEKPFLYFASYDDYVQASEKDYMIQILSEKNNIYRTMTAMLLLLVCVKIYDLFFYDFVSSCAVINNALFIVLLVLVAALFVFSYRKQTNYVRKRVEKVIDSSEK